MSLAESIDSPAFTCDCIELSPQRALGGWLRSRALCRQADRVAMWTYVLRHYARLRAIYANDLE